jgi:Holin of 3TMs, for gene-transfer release
MSALLQPDDFLTSKWRPAMAWAYMAICLFDFLVGPVLFNVLQIRTQMDISIWQPVTLQGGGLFHLAMGAVLGITSWTRGTEKIQRLQTLEQQALIESQQMPAYPVWQTPPVNASVQTSVTELRLKPLASQPLTP